MNKEGQNKIKIKLILDDVSNPNSFLAALVRTNGLIPEDKLADAIGIARGDFRTLLRRANTPRHCQV